MLVAATWRAVAGSGVELQHILRTRKIDEIVLAADLSSCKREILIEIAKSHGIGVVEWGVHENPLFVPAKESDLDASLLAGKHKAKVGT